MIHSRPGFAPRKSDAAPAKLNQDMVPAINRTGPKASPLVNASPSFEQMLNARAEEHRSAKLHAAPELLVNPTPSATPKVNEPGK
jgi:hypothetical protein